MPRVSIYIRILIFFSLLVFIPVAVTSYVDFRSEKRTIEQQHSQALEDLVNAAALGIDGDEVDGIRAGADGEIVGRAAFDAIQGRLLDELGQRNLSRGEYPLFVFRRSGDYAASGLIEFVVMTSLDPRGRHFVGLLYRAIPEQLAAFDRGRSSVTAIYSDANGSWISAIAPIYDSERRVVAIAQANFPVDYLYRQLRENAIEGLKTAGLSLLFCGLPALLFGRGLVRPIRELLEATQRFANNELEYRVRTKRNDELGDLAKNFNWMAEQLLVDRLKRVETEASLRNSEAEARKLALVASRTDSAVVIMDSEARIEWVNHSFQRVTGYELEEVEGRRLLDVLEGEETDAEAARRLRRELSAGNGCTVELINYRKDGQPIWSALEMQPVRNTAGDVVNHVAILADVTERRRAADELRQAKEAAELANKAKSEFLAVMSHEIRTPMNGVLGFTHLLHGTRLNAQQRDYTETIQSSAEALLALLNDILDFSKIESGRMDLERQPFELRQCVEDALDLIAATAARKNIEILARFDHRMPTWFVGDVTRLRQVIVNLAGNAVKFTEEGEIVVSVSGKRIEDEKVWEIHVRVKDSGVGIPEERRERLFKPFSQVDQSITRRFGGTGLGLAISKRLTELMGGRIWVESVPGEGSEFQFTARLEDTAPAENAPWEEHADRMKDRSVVVIDDNRQSLEEISETLRAWGMKPMAARTLEEAEKLMQSEDHADVVIMDGSFVTPEGSTFASRHASAQGEGGASLVVLTMIGVEDKVKELIGRRCSAVVSKPVHYSMLFNCLIEIVSGGEVNAGARGGRASKIDSSLGDRVPLKILLAEDNPTNQKLALLTLRQMGYKADVVGNGRLALEAIQREAYDLILMDVQMPEMDGLEATAQIRNYEGETHGPNGHRTRIVAMTANATVLDKEKCLAAGMDDYVSKPVRPEALQRALVRSPTESPEADAEGEGRRVQTIAAAESAIRELCDALEPEGVIEMAESFLSDVPEMILELRRTARAGSLAELERAAHSLKGAASIFNWKALSERALAVEDLAEAGNLADASAGIKAIEEEFQLAHGALERAVLQLKESLEA
jgi:PAS domain S-box-containing protein